MNESRANLNNYIPCSTARAKIKQALTLGIWLFLLSLFTFTAQADVTGYFRVSVDIIPQTTSLGSTPVQVDFQNDLTFTLQLGYFGWRKGH